MYYKTNLILTGIAICDYEWLDTVHLHLNTGQNYAFHLRERFNALNAWRKSLNILLPVKS